MTINVSQVTNSYSVRLKASPKFKVSVSAEASSVAGSLSDLTDVDVSGVQDSYVIMYDAATQKYKTVNPDLVLSKATVEPVQPGLPNDFVDKLDIDLDDKIDLDAGSF
jgi:hypothetical protein